MRELPKNFSGVRCDVSDQPSGVLTTRAGE
jgi:hypothetical protein